MAEPAPVHHHVSVDRILGALHLHVDLPLHAPWTLLFGPSGSGKSSLLRAACGLLGTAGVSFSRVEPGGNTAPLIAPAHATPLHRLHHGYAPQGGALFPHLNVAENVAFASSVRGTSADGASSGADLDELLTLFEIAPLAKRSPRMLSGGERQRVNLARAFAVPGARLLLLDEPFTGVDRELRNRLLPRMLTWTRERGLPVLSVSHDVDEALQLEADVVVLGGGRVIRRGPALTALAAERESLLRILDPIRDAYAAGPGSVTGSRLTP